MRRHQFFASLLLIASSLACGADGLITLKSAYSQEETLARLEQGLKARGMTLFNRIDHAAGAEKIGMTLHPTEVVIFGNPKGGTPFMQCAQTAGIDLPLKALVWEDNAGQVWLGYNDPAYLANRHGVPDCTVAGKIAKTLAEIAGEATQP